jgi:CBS domain-containing protein
MTSVREVMTPGPIGLPEDASLIDAARRMKEEGVGDVLMFSEAGVRGIVTDHDIVVRGLAQGADPNTTPIHDVATEPLATVQASESADRAAEMMREQSVRRLPVVEGDEVVGMVSIADLAPDRP